MNNRIKYIILGIAVVILSACDKKTTPPVPSENSPVFKAVGTINNSDVAIYAGINEGYMYTKKEKYNNVQTWQGSLIDNKTELSMIFFDGILDVPSLNSSIKDFKEFDISPYHYNEPLIYFSKEDFLNSDYIASVSWSVDGVIQENNILSIYEPGSYEICAYVQFNDGSQARTCNNMLIGYKNNVQSTLKYMIGENSKIIGYIDSQGEAILSIEWYLDGNLVSKDPVFKGYSNNEDFHLEAHIKFENGVYQEKEIFGSKVDNNKFIQDLTTVQNQVTSHWDHTVTVKLSNSGKHYISVPGQSSNSKLKVDEYAVYENAENGQLVSKITGTLNSSFLDLSSGEIVEGQFTFILGIPQ